METDPFRALSGLCQAVPRDWAAIDDTAERLRAARRALPADLAPIADEARSRCDCRRRLGDALRTRSARRAKAAYERASSTTGTLAKRCWPGPRGGGTG